MPEIIIQALNGLQKDLLYILHLYQSVLDDQKHSCNAAFYTSSDLRGGGQTFFRAFINSELGPPEVALTQNW